MTYRPAYIGITMRTLTYWPWADESDSSYIREPIIGEMTLDSRVSILPGKGTWQAGAMDPEDTQSTGLICYTGKI